MQLVCGKVLIQTRSRCIGIPAVFKQLNRRFRQWFRLIVHDTVVLHVSLTTAKTQFRQYTLV